MIASADQFIGQPAVLAQLGRAIDTGRLCGTLLLLGQRGLGKTTLATVIARALNCEQRQPGGGLHFCGECYACRSIATGNQPEYVEVRGNSKEITVPRVEHVYGGFHSAMRHPALMRFRVFVIDDAHYLNEETSSQMLKVFEEAPEQTLFILVTDQPHKLLPTILSRGLKFELQAIPEERLKEIVAGATSIGDPELIERAVAMSGGRFVDALALAQSPEWLDAVDRLARACVKRRGIMDAVWDLSSHEYAFLWAKDLRDRGLSEVEAEKLLAKKEPSKEEDKAALPIRKVRRNELERIALISACERAVWRGINSHGLGHELAASFYLMKERINQNVSNNLAIAAFEAELNLA